MALTIVSKEGDPLPGTAIKGMIIALTEYVEALRRFEMKILKTTQKIGW